MNSRSSRESRRGPRANRRLAFESLDPRLTPSSAPWIDAQHLSISFAPDGTDIANHESDLFATLNAVAPKSVWQREILRAFQSWSEIANVDFAVVPDRGQPLGADGRAQRDPRFGDIRIAAQKMSPEALSVSVPSDFAASGTWGGDIILNSDALFSIGDAENDLYSVFVHEIGHVLGLEHSADANSVMFSHAGELRTGLAPADVAAVRGLYGPRDADQYEGSSGNDVIDRATRFETPDHYRGATPLVMYGSVTQSGDSDFYELRPLEGYTGAISIRLQTLGQSLLIPRLEVYNEQGTLIARGRLANPAGGAVRLRLPASAKEQSYFLRVTSEPNSSYFTGRYALAAIFDDLNTVSTARLANVMRNPFDSSYAGEVEELFRDPRNALLDEEVGEDDDELLAVELETSPGYSEFKHYEAIGSLASAADADFYSVKSRRDLGSTPLVMTVAVHGVTTNGVDGHVQLLDHDGEVLPAEVLVNREGTIVLQATQNIDPSGEFFVRVFSGEGSDAAGNYSLTIDFGDRAAKVQTLLDGSLAAGTEHGSEAVFIARTQLFQFQLSSDQSGGLPMRAIVRDALGNVVTRFDTPAGGIGTSPALLLTPGPYLISYGVLTKVGAAPPAASFRLRGIVFGDPIGPAIADPTLHPMYVDPLKPGSYVYPVGAPSSTPYLFHELEPATTDGNGNPVYPPYMTNQFTWLASMPPWPL